LKSNRKEIDSIIKDLSETAQNANVISEESKELIESLSPDAKKLVSNISSISGRVDSTTETVSQFVGQVSESFNSTAHTIRSINDYIDIIVEIADIVKNTIKSTFLKTRTLLF